MQRLRAAEAPLQLTVDEQPVALHLTAALSVGDRSRGLLGRRSAPHALLLYPCSSVPSIGLKMALEVAYLDRDLKVLEVTDLPPWRMQLPRRQAVAVLEAEPRALATCGMRPGIPLGVAP